MDSSDDDLLIASAAFIFMLAATYRMNRSKKPKKSRKAVKPYLRQRTDKGRFKDVSTYLKIHCAYVLQITVYF